MKLKCCEQNKTKNQLNQTVNFLKIISEENRLKILCVLKKQEMCVCEIWQQLGVPQNLASHHLKVLNDFGLINFKKEGVKVIYSLDQKKLDKYKNLLLDFIN